MRKDMSLENCQALESQEIVPTAIERLSGTSFSIENSICAPNSPSLKLVGGLLNHHPENSASLPLVTWIACPS